MIKDKIKLFIPHLIAIVLFLIISYIFFSPALEGKKLRQGDMTHFKGMSKEIVDFREEFNEEPLWSGSMFSGMPAYLTSTVTPAYSLSIVNQIFRFTKRPFDFIFVAFICAYIALLLFKVNPYLSIIGAIAYGLSSYFIIIIEAGHTSKMYALGYMPAIIAAVWYTFNGRKLLGAVLTGLFLGLQLLNSHLQITYYTLIIILVFGMFFLIDAFKKKEMLNYFKGVALLSAMVLLAMGSNATRLWITNEYGKFSIRGKSELTLNSEIKTKNGLDRDYITAFSIGRIEGLSVLIPNIQGGSPSKGIGKDSELFKTLKKNRVPNAANISKSIPTYWGPQTWTQAVYFGSIIVFLFVFGLFAIRGPVKWWLFSVSIISLLLAMGKHLPFLTNLFIDYFPGYSKFRSVNMTLVIAGFAMPFLGFIAVNDILKGKIDKKQFLYALKWSLGIVGGICLLFIIMPGAFLTFEGKTIQQLVNSKWPPEFIDAIKTDRKSLVVNDAMRSLFFISASAILIYLFFEKKLKIKPFLLLLGLFVLVDLWVVDKRHLNSDNFVREKTLQEAYKPSQANLSILSDKDPNFRVFNTTLNPFTDASTSYFHKSIGGYHGAKMKRYQDLVEYHLVKNNMDVFNMLNTKYFIVKGNNDQPEARMNVNALGNVWFVDSFKVVETADDEILALNDFDPSLIAVVNKSFSNELSNLRVSSGGEANIQLDSYKANHLVYSSKLDTSKLAVFSEIYYPKGWNAYIDGELKNHFRVNYVLRAMVIPEGEHKIEFKFEPKSYYLGDKISLASSSILIILLILVFVAEIRKNFIKIED